MYETRDCPGINGFLWDARDEAQSALDRFGGGTIVPIRRSDEAELRQQLTDAEGLGGGTNDPR
jgi:hypothetical protein